MHRMVDGKKVECKSDEEAAIRAEWADDDKRRSSYKPPVDDVAELKKRLAALEAKIAG
jgi:hypothetical protein